MLSLTFYTNKVPTGFAGCAGGPVVLIRPAYRADVGLLKHEQMHVDQWWLGVLLGCVVAALLQLVPALAPWAQFWPVAVSAGAVLHPLAYKAIWQYRLWAEVQCYREQAQHYPDDRRLFFAQSLFTKYALAGHVTHEQILGRLKA